MAEPSQPLLPAPLRICTGFALRRAARAVTQLYDRMLAPAGLRSTQFSVLGLAAAQHGLPIARMADALGMDRTTLTRNLQPLVRKGWLKIEPGRDQRERRVRVTPEGLETLDKALPLWNAAQRELEATLGVAVRGRLMGDLSSLSEAMAEKSPSALE